MSDFDALLIADALAVILAAGLAARGHLSIALRRKPQPAKPQPAKPKEPTP